MGNSVKSLSSLELFFTFEDSVLLQIYEPVSSVIKPTVEHFEALTEFLKTISFS